MNGIDFLLDTNFILGLLKSSPDTLALIDERQIELHQCAYSAITRMELLGFPGITCDEEAVIQERLACLAYAPVSSAVEDIAIRLRQTYRVKLPDAIIAASALAAGAELLTFDKALQGVCLPKWSSRPTVFLERMKILGYVTLIKEFDALHVARAQTAQACSCRRA